MVSALDSLNLGVRDVLRDEVGEPAVERRARALHHRVDRNGQPRQVCRVLPVVFPRGKFGRAFQRVGQRSFPKSERNRAGKNAVHAPLCAQPVHLLAALQPLGQVLPRARHSGAGVTRTLIKRADGFGRLSRIPSGRQLKESASAQSLLSSTELLSRSSRLAPRVDSDPEAP